MGSGMKRWVSLLLFAAIFGGFVQAEPPQLVPKGLVNGVFELSLASAEPGKFTLYGSTDLLTWVALTNVTSGESQVLLTDPDAGSFSFRFYRATAEPAEMLAPVITAQPQSQTVEEGATVTFEVAASGTGVLIYQWMFNGQDISEAYDPQLTINYAQTGDAGNYTVLVSNLDGSGRVVSQAAVLTVNPTSLTPETLAGRTMWMSVVDGVFPFAQRGAAYNIQFASNANTYVIVPGTSDVSPSSGTYEYTKTGPTTATITVNDSENGLLTTQLTFLNLRDGTFSSTAGQARQTGEFTLR
jgi:hypothetical protein